MFEAIAAGLVVAVLGILTIDELFPKQRGKHGLPKWLFSKTKEPPNEEKALAEALEKYLSKGVKMRAEEKKGKD